MILPTQQLDQGTKVIARYSEMNYCAGRFHFILQDDGNLVFYANPGELVSWDAYWVSNTENGIWLIFNQSCQVSLMAMNGTVLNHVTSETIPTSGFYQRAILEYDGVFRQYVHPKIANSSSGWAMGWLMVSSPVSSNICLKINQNIGTGACGFNSYCTIGDDQMQRPQCQCPPRYTLYVLVNLILLIINYLNPRSLRSRDSKLLRPVQINQASGMQTFTYQELQEATDGFKEELGRGAFGAVYKGVLRSEDTNFVAVKMLETRNGASEKEFEREVSAIAQTNHKNSVQLLGFCNEGQHRLLVYEFMSNGTLVDFLFGSSRPSWHKRTEIAYGVARGLSYLHGNCTRHIIHCDIKPRNILLDGSLAAKISDFELAKLLTANQTRTTIGVRGTRGYLALEWFRNMPISSKVDVYSFGILLV
ncbi:hypothetical protein NL676_012596 [Syzygium grande]|nr:hypothetical protein NL676_012596 [Syzygium grande]